MTRFRQKLAVAVPPKSTIAKKNKNFSAK